MKILAIIILSLITYLIVLFIEIFNQSIQIGIWWKTSWGFWKFADFLWVINFLSFLFLGGELAISRLLTINQEDQNSKEKENWKKSEGN